MAPTRKEQSTMKQTEPTLKVKQKSTANKGKLDQKRKIEKKRVNANGKEKPRYIPNPRQPHVQNIVFEYQKAKRRKGYQKQKEAPPIIEEVDLMDGEEQEVEGTFEEEMSETQANKGSAVEKYTANSGNQLPIYRNAAHSDIAKSLAKSKIVCGCYINWDDFAGCDFVNELKGWIKDMKMD
ncbi:hypothetical protein CCACVL1_28741 [Corchorus capsularis]|uniref:Uncharacterized protein n=1 Tax=Corchorus capsularis TaxID=210143 RepID=A0A1R3G5D4_COCAP|nr:hypothetical protein CCACVL1_28741 [Corchorus capsularis]